MVVGAYVGCATVGVFVTWYLCDSFLGIDLSQDGHSTVSWHQLSHWEECPKWEGFHAGPYTAGSSTVSFESPCDYFTTGVRGCVFGGSRVVVVMAVE
jgi:Ca2+-transporting ATPase